MALNGSRVALEKNRIFRVAHFLNKVNFPKFLNVHFNVKETQYGYELLSKYNEPTYQINYIKHLPKTIAKV